MMITNMINKNNWLTKNEIKFKMIQSRYKRVLMGTTNLRMTYNRWHMIFNVWREEETVIRGNSIASSLSFTWNQ